MFDPVTLASLNKRKTRVPGFLTCPAVLDWESRVYAIRSPYSFRLRAVIEGQDIRIHPVYPETEISAGAIGRYITVEARSTWRHSDSAVVQLALPYVFLADEDVALTQMEPPAPAQGKPWSLVSGRFNIFEWQRPINWACEWNMRAGDLVVSRGQILCLLSFESTFDARHELVRVPMSDDIRAAIDATIGVTSLVRGTSGLFGNQRQRRPERLMP